MTKPTCSVRQDGREFYVSYFRGTRSSRTFKTISGAIRHANHRGEVVDMNDLPNPKATSVASMVSVYRPRGNETGYTLTFNEGGAYIKGSVESMNHVLKKMGYKPVRVTSNLLNDASPLFCIDADTPLSCDPGSETYHSM